jgi:hypothetical protein
VEASPLGRVDGRGQHPLELNGRRGQGDRLIENDRIEDGPE